MNLVEIGARIKTARKKRGLSQAELAERIGINTSYLSDIENGKKNFGIEILMKLTEALGISADWLLRANIQESAVITKNEASELLKDCTADEMQAMIAIIDVAKKWLRKDIMNNDRAKTKENSTKIYSPSSHKRKPYEIV